MSKCHCGNDRAKEWHMVCPACWDRLPQDLRDEVYDAYVEKKGSSRHVAAIRACLEFLKKAGA